MAALGEVFELIQPTYIISCRKEKVNATAALPLVLKNNPEQDTRRHEDRGNSLSLELFKDQTATHFLNCLNRSLGASLEESTFKAGSKVYLQGRFDP